MSTSNDIQRDTGNVKEEISAQDPLTILAGIEQFGLAADGSDLRDLREALSRTGAVKVKPLDLSNLLRHAFFEGVMIAGGSQEAAAEWWPKYDPETCSAYSRIVSALSPAPEAQQEPFCWIPTTTAEWLQTYDGPACATRTTVHNRPIKTDGGVSLYTRPSEQAVTDEMVEAASREYMRIFGKHLLSKHARLILTAAQEAGR